jgi:hypothetical protein
VVRGTTFQLNNLTIGSMTAGLSRGSRYTLRLK